MPTDTRDAVADLLAVLEQPGTIDPGFAAHLRTQPNDYLNQHQPA